jgi:Glycosyltransferase
MDYTMEEHMKKILIMAKSLGGGGSEVALIELLNKIDYTNYDVTLALLDRDDEYASRLNQKVKIIYIEFKRSVYHKLVSMYSFLSKVLKKLKVNRYIHYYDWLFDKVSTDIGGGYDIALDFYGYGYFLTGYLAEKVEAKRKATWLHAEIMPWMRNVERYLSKYCKVCCVSKAVYCTFIKEFPKAADKAEVIYNVIDTDRIKRLSQEPITDKLDGTFNILTVGRLHNEKGYDIAIRAARLLCEANIDFKWYAIGAGSEHKKLQKLVKQYNLENKFIFLGRRDNPYPYMTKCDLYVQPSRHEGYGITIVEARVLKLPILASDIPPIREQIHDGKTGYLVELKDADLANKIRKLYMDRSLMDTVVDGLRHEIIDFKNEIEKIYAIC